MIDDPLERQLRTLQRVEAPPPPSVADLEALLRQGREKSRARRLAVAASAAAVAAGAGAVWTVGIRDPGDASRSSDVSSAGPDGAVDSEVGGVDDCDLAGPDPATPPQPWDVAGIGDALEARFPSCFGGIVNIGGAEGPPAVEIYVLGEDPEVLELARELLGPGVEVTMRPSERTWREVRALKDTIDADVADGDLAAEGIDVNLTGMRIEGDGPKVWVGLGTDTPEIRARLEELYGEGWLTMVESSGVVPG